MTQKLFTSFPQKDCNRSVHKVVGGYNQERDVWKTWLADNTKTACTYSSFFSNSYTTGPFLPEATCFRRLSVFFCFRFWPCCLLLLLCFVLQVNEKKKRKTNRMSGRFLATQRLNSFFHPPESFSSLPPRFLRFWHRTKDTTHDMQVRSAIGQFGREPAPQIVVPQHLQCRRPAASFDQVLGGSAVFQHPGRLSRPFGQHPATV